MRIIDSSVDVALPGSAHGVVRCAVVSPATAHRSPLLLCFPDIFGNSEAHLRVMRRFAGHGYVVVSPEPWHHHLPPGSVLDFDADRDKALACQDIASAQAVDDARAAIIAHFKDDTSSVLAVGFCYGGHLSFRAAARAPEVQAAACFYGTGLHKDLLGNVAATTLNDAANITGEVLLVWGVQDPHIPREGRAKIHRALDDASVRYETRLYDAEHAFARDVGPRYDPQATDAAIDATLSLFARVTTAAKR